MGKYWPYGRVFLTTQTVAVQEQVRSPRARLHWFSNPLSLWEEFSPCSKQQTELRMTRHEATLPRRLLRECRVSGFSIAMQSTGSVLGCDGRFKTLKKNSGEPQAQGSAENRGISESIFSDLESLQRIRKVVSCVSWRRRPSPPGTKKNSERVVRPNHFNFLICPLLIAQVV